MDCTSHQPPLRNSWFVMLSSCLATVFILFVLFIVFLFDPFIKFFEKKKKKDNGIFMNVKGGCGRSPWSVTNLCPVVPPWPLRDIWMYVWLPPALRSSHDLYCMSSSSYWVVLQENVCHQPLNMCLNDISPVCLWECVFLRDGICVCVSTDRDYWDATDQIRGAKMFFSGDKNFQRDKSWWATRFSFPPCVDDLLCPDSVVLTACLCSFCHTKATSSASAHNCLIPHDAKLELFALLQMNMGILRRVQIAILI